MITVLLVPVILEKLLGFILPINFLLQSSLRSIGYNINDSMKPKFPGGEDEGLTRLNNMMARTKWVQNFCEHANGLPGHP